jgi:hypothetical protein
MVVGEGEFYTSRTIRFDKGVDNSWFVVPDEDSGSGSITNARGGAYVQALPDNGSAGAPIVPPEIMYKMQIFNPGTYRLYIRREGSDVNFGASDSIFMDIVELKDGATLINPAIPAFGTSTNLIADWYEAAGNVDGDFATVAWRSVVQPEVNSAGASGFDADWVIPTSGVYTLRFTQREDGAAIDAWVFQLESLPAPSGYGPPISPFEFTRLVALTTDDTFLRRADTNAANYSSGELLVKNDGQAEPSGLDRVAYLRFDISSLQGLGERLVLSNAVFKIDLIDEAIGTNHNIFVAVIAEDAASEDFSETNIWPAVSDAWSDSVDEAVDFSKVYGGAPVGSFEIDASDEGSTINFSSPGLLSAIRNDIDGVLSLMLYRVRDDTQVDKFASKEHSSLNPPTLEVNFWFPPVGTLIMIN